MTATTIKVSTETRDRINELAADLGITAGSVIEKVLDDYLWRQQVEAAIAQMRAMTPADRAEYLAELATMDGSLTDGLEAYADDHWHEAP